MADLILKIDIKAALAALLKLNKGIDDTGKKADDSFGRARDELGRFIATGEKGGKKLSSAFGGLNLSIGATAGTVGALSIEFLQLAKVAVTAFLEITAGAIDLNKEAEITRLALIAIFEGNEKAADAFIDTIGDLAVKLGTSRQELTGFAKGILPDVGTVGGTAELLKNVIILGKDAGARIDDIRRTLEGALVGDFVGFQDVLNIPPQTIKKIKELAKEIGNAEAITAILGDRIQDQGLSIEAFAGTLDTLENKLAAQFQNFQKILGESPFEELKEQAQAFLELFEEKEPEITRVAQAFGDLAANVIEFVGTNLISFIEGIDFEGVEKLVDGFNDAVDAGKLLLDVFFDLDDATPFNSLIAGLTKVVEKLKEAAIAGAQLGAIVEAKAARDTAEALKAAELSGFGIETPEGKRIAPFLVKGFLTVAENAEIAAAGQDAFNAVMNESLEAFEDLDEAQEKSTKRTEDRRKVVKDTTAADIAAGEAVLANKKALAELADAQLAAGKAQEEISKKRIEFGIEQEKRRTEFLLRQSEKREQIELKSTQNREKAIFQFNQNVASLTAELLPEEAKVSRDAARKRIQIDRDASQARIQVERDFRQELGQIQDQFNQEAADAERTNDAQSFLRAIRAKDQQVKVATQERDISLEDVDIGAKRQREELKAELKIELQDVQENNRQKLADLQDRLNKQLELQEFSRLQEIERQDLADQQGLDRFERTEAERQGKLAKSLEKQFALLEAAKAKEIELTSRAEAEKTRIVIEEMARRAGILAERAALQEQAGVGALPIVPIRGDRRGALPFQGGGRPPVGRPVKVGEAGPEIFVPDTAGTIIPNNAIFSPPAQALPLTQMSSNVTNNSPTFNLAESMFQDPIARRNLTNFVLGVLAERV